MTIVSTVKKTLERAAFKLAGIVLGLVFALHLPSSSSDWAAWVQAFGSILAIICAFDLGQRQVNAARKQAQEKEESDDRNKRESIAAIAQNAIMQADSVTRLANATSEDFFRASFSFPVHMLDEAIDSLAAIPLHAVGSYRAVMGITGLIGAIKKIRSASCVFLESSPGTSDFQSFREHLKWLYSMASTNHDSIFKGIRIDPGSVWDIELRDRNPMTGHEE